MYVNFTMIFGLRDEQFDDIDYEEGMVLEVQVCHKRRFKEPIIPAVSTLPIASLGLVNSQPLDHTITFKDGSSLDLTLVVDDGESLFGLSIGLAAKREKQNIPTIVTTCVEMIKNGPRGLAIEGLYRIPGKASAIKEFKAAFNDSHLYTFEPGTNPNWIVSGTENLGFFFLTKRQQTKAQKTSHRKKCCQHF